MYRMAEYSVMAKELERLDAIFTGIKDELDNMKNTASNLDIFWDGEANAKFMLNINSGILSAVLLLEKMKRFGTFLSYALTRYQKSEKEISELLGGLS